jgi:hypothetical protein
VQRATSAQGVPTWTDVTLIHRDLFLCWPYGFLCWPFGAS